MARTPLCLGGFAVGPRWRRLNVQTSDLVSITGTSSYAILFAIGLRFPRITPTSKHPADLPAFSQFYPKVLTDAAIRWNWTATLWYYYLMDVCGGLVNQRATGTGIARPFLSSSPLPPSSLWKNDPPYRSVASPSFPVWTSYIMESAIACNVQR